MIPANDNQTRKNKMIDISGKRFGRLIAIKPLGSNGKGDLKWLCRCDCGNECIKLSSCMRRGITKSCGCLRAELNHRCKHGLSYSRIWRIYSGMKNRCYREIDEAYKDYGGRGITVCDEWLGKDGFSNFVKWAYANGYSDSLTIDRIDNNKGYSFDNCRWVDMKTQCRNRRSNHLLTFNGETKTISEWSEITGIRKNTILYRVSKGWDIGKALSKEANNGKENCTDK